LSNLDEQRNGYIMVSTWNTASGVQYPGWGFLGRAGAVRLTQPEFLPTKACHHLYVTYPMERETTGSSKRVIRSCRGCWWYCPINTALKINVREKWNQIQTNELGKKIKETRQLQINHPGNDQDLHIKSGELSFVMWKNITFQIIFVRFCAPIL